MPTEGEGPGDEGHIGEDEHEHEHGAGAGPRLDPCFEGEGLRSLAQLLRLLCEETRLRILFTLAAGESDVTGLWGPMGLPQATVSHHLSFLRLANLVSTRREGKHIFYRLGPGANVAGRGALAIESPTFALRLELRGGVAKVTEVRERFHSTEREGAAHESVKD